MDNLEGKARKIIDFGFKRWNSLEDERIHWLTAWNEIADLILSTK